MPPNPATKRPTDPADPSDPTGETTVLLQVFGVSRRRMPAALWRMATSARGLRGTPGLTFRKLLGTGTGRTFTVRDADPKHWVMLTVWADDNALDAFRAGHEVTRRWDAIATERLDVRLRPLGSRGLWSGVAPFGDPLPRKVSGPVASITRARIRPTRMATFWRAVPAVSRDLHQVDGLAFALGIGEAPLGWQGTFSLWHSATALSEFAHRRSPHVDAILRTATVGWYAEELFARFEVLQATGTYDGHPVTLASEAP